MNILKTSQRERPLSLVFYLHRLIYIGDTSGITGLTQLSLRTGLLLDKT